MRATTVTPRTTGPKRIISQGGWRLVARRWALVATFSGVFLVALSEDVLAQEFSLGLEIDEVACGEDLDGEAGTTIRLNVTAYVEAAVAGVEGAVLSIAGSGGSITFGFDPCDPACASVIVGKDVRYFAAVHAMENGVIAVIEQSGSREAFLDVGRTGLFRIYVDVTVPTVPVEEPREEVRIHFQDGLTIRDGEVTFYNSVVFHSTEWDPLLGECTFEVSAGDSFFLRADCNDDGAVDISDAVSTLGSLFLGDGDPVCDDACDSNDDGAVDISDAIATLGVLFLGNGTIPLPGMTECGVDPTDDEVGCTEYNGCP